MLQPKPLDNRASDLFTCHGFQQIIDIPTRFAENTVSLISLIFVDNSDDVVCHGTVHKIADHDGVLVSFKTKSQKQFLKTRKMYDYKNANVEGLIQHIKKYDFDNVVFGRPIPEQAEAYTKVLKQSFEQFLPIKTITIRPNDAPLCNV